MTPTPTLQIAHCQKHLAAGAAAAAAACRGTSTQAPKRTLQHLAATLMQQHQHPGSNAHTAIHIWRRTAMVPAPRLQSAQSHRHLAATCSSTLRQHHAAAPAPKFQSEREYKLTTKQTVSTWTDNALDFFRRQLPHGHLAAAPCFGAHRHLYPFFKARTPTALAI